MLEQINSLIAQCTKYGIRKEITQNKGYVLDWSNNQAKWFIYGDMKKKNEVLNLDANMIFVPGKRKDILAVIDQLNPLPLYNNSFEVVYRQNIT